MGSQNEPSQTPGAVDDNTNIRHVVTDEKTGVVGIEPSVDGDVDSNTGGLAGVEKIEAMTQTWTMPWLIASYLL